MRVIMLAAALAALTAGAATAQVHVDGYTRSDGRYVQPHYRSAPNDSVYDNYSTRGNTNPYTGARGTSDPYGSSDYGYSGSRKRYP